MKRAMGLVLIGFLWMWSSSPAAADRAGAELLQLENDFAAALSRGDRGRVEDLLADGFVYSEGTETMTADALLDALFEGPDRIRQAHNQDMEVHLFGRAVVTGWLLVAGDGAGGPFSRRYRYTDTWVRRGGRWRLAAAHDVLAAESR